jgi:ElaB/YqjD/DUF883 family membrane-anchored ribosome-binding protein
MTEDTVATREARIAEDLRTVIADAETLLRDVATEAGELGADARDKLVAQLEGARARLAELETKARETAKESAKATDTWVRDNPWQAVGIGVGAGLVLGLLIGRR